MINDDDEMCDFFLKFCVSPKNNKERTKCILEKLFSPRETERKYEKRKDKQHKK